MQFRVLLFGPAAAAAGTNQITLESASPLTAAATLERLAENPRLRPLLQGARLAVNHAFVSPDHPITGRDEVALIAMVSGG
jgi:molybdopterin converting factor small subunit